MPATSIHEAAQAGDLDQVRALLDERPELVDADDKYEWRPVFHAGLHKHYDVVKLLVDCGADLSAHDGYVLHYAGQVPGNERIIELLVKYGALDAHTEPASQQARQFIYALFLANASRVGAMLQASPELAHERYARGDTALHHAARNGDLPIVRLLVEAGADVNALAESGHFPLYCAAGHRHVKTTRYLLDQGADIDQTFPSGETIVEWLQQYAEDDALFAECLDVITRGVD